MIEEVKNVSPNKLGVGSSDHASFTDCSGSVFMRKSGYKWERRKTAKEKKCVRKLEGKGETKTNCRV